MNDISEKIADLSPVKLALMARKIRQGIEGVEYLDLEPLAIVGMGCRFPGHANDLESFWRLLESGQDAFDEVPLEKWDVSEYYDENKDAPGKMYTRTGAYIERLGDFDAQFFGISPNEANSMDPQQRMALEVAWEALDNAGISAGSLVESLTGVYMGVGQIDYADLELKGPDPKQINAYTGTGLLFSAVSGRISYLFGFQGPSVTVDGACASSLMTVHLACQALRKGECDLALAGGVHLVLTPNMTVYLSRSKALSPDGICKTFDASANGYARGEGCGILVLKRLSDALAAGDQILALIRGSALNHGGPSQGFTVPSGVAQQKLIRDALRVSGVKPDQITYIEAHGTGTSLGDPIEVNALNQVFRKGREKGNPLFIGSVKTNIGHLEAAAGVAGLIKTVLALKHKMIPPHLHFKNPNPNMDLSAIPISIPTTLTPWNPPGGRRLAGISSFGITGQNAHVILEEAPELPRKKEEKFPARNILFLSARSANALLTQAASFADFVERSENNEYDICQTASRRTIHNFRMAVVGENRTEMVRALRAAVAGEGDQLLVAPRKANSKNKIAFVFSGQGQQWWAMGRGLLEKEPIFADTIRQIDGYLKESGATWSLLEELGRAESETRLDETEIAQPAIFALQVALTSLLRSYGIEPSGVTGHSVGDVAAAHVSGLLALPQAVRVIYHRARLMQAATGLGKMAAVDAPADKIKEFITAFSGRVEIGALNSPNSCVLSGEEKALNEILRKLEEKKFRVKLLPVNYAFHSPQMEPFKDALSKELQGLKLSTQAIALYSTVTGKIAGNEDYNPVYWGRNIRQAVLFDPAVAAMVRDGFNCFIEISAHPVLSNYIEAICEKNQSSETAVVSLLRRNVNDMTAFGIGIAACHVVGIHLDFSKLFPVKSQAVELPVYQWEHKRFWVNSVSSANAPVMSGSMVSGRPFNIQRLRSPLDAIQFQCFFSAETPYYLRDHVLYEEVVVPGASHMALILFGAREAFGEGNYYIEESFFHQALVLPVEKPRFVQLIFEKNDDGYRFRVTSTGVDEEEQGNWILHADGRLRYVEKPEPLIASSSFDSGAVMKRATATVSCEEFYENFWSLGYHLTDTFRWIDQAWRRDGEVLGRMKAPVSVTDSGEYVLFPSLFDAFYQLATLALPHGGLNHFIDGKHIYVPWTNAKFQYYGQAKGYDGDGSDFWCHIVCHEKTARKDQEVFRGDLALYAPDGRLVAEIKDWALKRVSGDSLLKSIRGGSDWLYELAWKPAGGLSRPDRGKPGDWLILTDRTIGNRLAAELGGRTIFVQPGSEFKKIAKNSYELDPGVRENFDKLLKDAFTGAPPRGIISLWALDATPEDQTNPATLTEDEKKLCGSILHLGQALSATGWTKMPELSLVTRGVQVVEKDDNPRMPAAASLWGLGRVIALENPDVWRGLIDLDPRENADEISMLAREILASERLDHIAFRGAKRYSAELVASRSISGVLQLESSGVYLITGGTGGLGLKIAEWLAVEGTKNIVLTGRREPSVEAQKAISLIEKKGSKVTFLKGNIATEKDAITILERTKKIAPLKGIIHAAGVLDDGILVQQTWERFEKVLEPKVQGAWNLHQLTRDENLDFFALFSSVASLTGSPGQASYSAANAFMDGLAHLRRAQNLPAISINWGPWAEVGMAAGIGGEAAGRGWTAPGVGKIDVERGLDLLKSLLKSDIAQVGVLPFRWPKLFEQFPIMAKQTLFRTLARRYASSGSETDAGNQLEIVKKIEGAVPEKRYNILQEFVHTQLAKVLGFEPAHPIDPKKGFFELGGDSLSSVELRNRLQSSVGKTLPTTMIFDYPSIEAITGFLAGDVFEISQSGTGIGPETAEPEPEIIRAELAAQVDSLSDEEAEAELLKELAALEE